MYIPNSSLHEIIHTIEELNIQKNESVLIMFAEQQLPDISVLICELNKREIDFFGAIFPGLLYGSEKYHSGVIIQTLPVLQRPVLIQDLSDKSDDIESLFVSHELPDTTNPAAFVIVDGLSSGVFTFLSSVFNVFGDSFNYFGGGAGSLSFEKQPCIFNPDGFFEDSAIIAFLDMQSELGVRHGLQRIIGPIVATKTDNNIIMELNWKNAFQVFQEAVEADSGKKLNKSNFFDISKNYAFGIYCEGDEDIVRASLTVNYKGELFCAGEVPENAVLNILKGNQSSFINSAENALEACLVPGRIDVKHCFLMDCIARSLILGDNFKEELKTITNGLESRNINVIPQGALSIGEIASRKDGILEFFNTTIVVGVFYESTGTVQQDH